MTTLSELFAIDPEALTVEQKHEIVDRLRADRKLWTKEQSTTRAVKGRPTGKMPRPGKAISLDDLGDLEI